MTFEEMLNRARKSGEEQFGKLILQLLELGRLDDLKQAAEDIFYRHQLYVEFGLDEEKTE